MIRSPTLYSTHAAYGKHIQKIHDLNSQGFKTEVDGIFKDRNGNIFVNIYYFIDYKENVPQTISVTQVSPVPHKRVLEVKNQIF